MVDLLIRCKRSLKTLEDQSSKKETPPRVERFPVPLVDVPRASYGRGWRCGLLTGRVGGVSSLGRLFNVDFTLRRQVPTPFALALILPRKSRKRRR